MTKFAVTLSAALALTFAAVSGAPAATPVSTVQVPSAGSLGTWPPDCLRVPPYPVKCPNV